MKSIQNYQVKRNIKAILITKQIAELIFLDK